MKKESTNNFSSFPALKSVRKKDSYFTGQSENAHSASSAGFTV